MQEVIWYDAATDRPRVGTSVLVLNGGFFVEAIYDEFAFCETSSWDGSVFLARLGDVTHWVELEKPDHPSPVTLPTKTEVEKSTRDYGTPR